MTELLLCEQRDAVVILTLNLPEKRNPISDDEMVEALVTKLESLDRDPSVRAVILTGAGSAFSAGGDIKKMAAGVGLRDPLPAQTRRNYKTGIQRLPLMFEALEVPVIAAVNGPAIGAGCDLACMCDIRIAAESARFAESFVKIGIVPGDGGAWLLPRVIGFARASELALTGETIDARQALEWGLVSRVVPDSQLIETAQGIAQKIAANPPHAVRMTKRLLRQAHNATLSATLETSAAMQALAHATADHEEALRAMLERRAPEFKGT